MAALHITEADLARDIAAVLDRVQSGSEVVIERDTKPIAVLRAAEPPRRKLSEILALTPKDPTATMDADFARDVEAAIAAHREPLDSSKWG
jgi:antitoxin (DNA-binding transcriptional repressor) of toxin-antitoxin stability system